MLTKNRFQNTAVVLSTIMTVVSSPAMADQIASKSKAIPQALVNLDLCTLAYQLYHQSLCLPLDPWYDIMSRTGSDRRNNITRFTHDYATKLGGAVSGVPHSPADQLPGQCSYSGPGAARGWRDSNFNLDPILTNYKQIDAKLPAFTRDGERFAALFAPPYVTENIKTIEGVRYTAKPTNFLLNDVERFQIRDYPRGEDHIIVFEGGTGIVGTTAPSWSLMGFVLMHKTQTGYDAHIVFRGSRSGASLGKTVWRAQDAVGAAKGNPDWITDLRGVKQIEQPLISKVGTVTEGFAESLPTMLGPIAACCQYLEQKYPAPEHIFVTGHSLGAGLASQFVSAVLLGSYGDALRKTVKGWDWGKTTLMAYAQPIPGDPAWAAEFDKISPSSEHYWVEGDSVVEATSNRLVSMVIDKGEHCGVQKKLTRIDACNDNPHEVFVIRDSLVRDLASVDPSLSQQLGRENTWAYYETFLKMLAGQANSFLYPGAPAPNIVTEATLRQILKNGNFSAEFANWLEQVYAKMIAEKSSYIGPKFQSTLDERRNLVRSVAEWMRKPPSGDKTQDLDSLVNEFQLIDGNLGLTAEEQLIYCGLILSRIQNTTLTLDELLSKPTIKACLESKFD